MGLADYLSDLYSSLTMQSAEAEAANAGPEDSSGEQSRTKDARAGGVGTAQHDRGAGVQGGASTKSPVAGTNEESEGEKQENEKTAQSTKARTSPSGPAGDSGHASAKIGDNDDGDDASADDDSDGKEGEDGGEDGGDEADGEEGGEDEDEEEEEEEEEEPEDIMPKLQDDCMKTAQCAPLKHHYDECAERVQHQENQHGKAHEDCVEEFFHLMHCASQCAAPKLFRQLR